MAAEAADVFLMWPDTTEGVKDLLADMDERSAAYGRKLRYGYRVHVIVRETESQAMGRGPTACVETLRPGWSRDPQQKSGRRLVWRESARGSSFAF